MVASVWRKRLKHLGSPAVLLRIIADVLLIQVTLIAVACMEIVIAAAGARVDVLEANAPNILLQRWLGVVVWWLLYGPVVTVAFLITRGVYGGRRRSSLDKAAQIALVGVSHAIFWTALLAVFPSLLAIPRYGSSAGLVVVPVVLIAARASLLLLNRGGVIASVTPRRDHRSPIQTVLIIGGAGYIGSVLARLLITRGYRVRVLDSLMYGEGSLKALEGNRSFEFRRGDARDLSALVSAAHGADAIVHLAAIVGDSACELDHDLTLEVNLLASRSIKEVATALGVKRLVFASTCSVYGATEEVADEQSIPHPVSLYGRTKLLSEHLLLAPDSSGLATTILRFATIYGLSARPRFDLVVNLFAAQAFDEGRIAVYGGTQWRPLLHVRDAARAITSVLEAPVSEIDHEIFNVGAEAENYTIDAIAETVTRIVGGQVLRMEGVRDQRTYRVSFAKARTALGFRPTVRLDEGIRELVEALRSGSIDDFRRAEYSNVRHLTKTNVALRRDKQLRELAESA